MNRDIKILSVLHLTYTNASLLLDLGVNAAFGMPELAVLITKLLFAYVFAQTYVNLISRYPRPWTLWMIPALAGFGMFLSYNTDIVEIFKPMASAYFGISSFVMLRVYGLIAAQNDLKENVDSERMSSKQIAINGEVRNVWESYPPSIAERLKSIHYGLLRAKRPEVKDTLLTEQKMLLGEG